MRLLNVGRIALALALLLPGSARAASTINTSVPAPNEPLQSAPIRNNFVAAASDYNAMLGMFATNNCDGIAGPTVGQLCLNNGTTPNLEYEWDGAQWVLRGTFDRVGHAYTGAFGSPLLAWQQLAPGGLGSAGQCWTSNGTGAVPTPQACLAPAGITATAPLAWNSGTSTVSLAYSADFTLATSTLALAAVQTLAHTWSLTQTFTLAPVFTDASGTRTALGLGALATVTPGTGVATALAVNIGTAGSVLVNGGALGTPSSGTATNLSGTAASLTAGNVTGTGVASATSLALGGATIGGNALAVTGSTLMTGALAVTGTITGGTNGGTAGQIILNGSTSGSQTIKVAAAAGSLSALQLPTTDGSNNNVLSTNGSGVLSWAAAGAGTLTSLVCNGGLTGGTITTTGTCAVDIATGSNFMSGTASKILDAAVIYQGETTSTFNATQVLDFNTFVNTKVTMTGNISSFTCSNQKAGQSGTIRFIQDGTGSRTLPATFGCNFKFTGGVQPVASTAINTVDALFYSCSATNYCLASFGKAQSFLLRHDFGPANDNVPAWLMTEAA